MLEARFRSFESIFRPRVLALERDADLDLDSLSMLEARFRSFESIFRPRVLPLRVLRLSEEVGSSVFAPESPRLRPLLPLSGLSVSALASSPLLLLRSGLLDSAGGRPGSDFTLKISPGPSGSFAGLGVMRFLGGEPGTRELLASPSK